MLRRNGALAAVAILSGLAAVMAGQAARGADMPTPPGRPGTPAPAGGAAKTAPAEASRHFRMGFTGFPHDMTVEALLESRRFVRQHGDIIAHHIEGVPWAECLAGSSLPRKMLDDWNGKRASTPPKGKVYLAVSPGRGELKLAEHAAPIPVALKGKPYDDPQVMKAFLAYCRSGIDFFRPDYLAIGIEVNEIRQAGADRWRAYAELHRHIYRELKKEHKDLPVFASFTLHGMLNAKGARRREMLDAFCEIMPQNDLVAVSFYPFIAGGTTDIAGAFGWLTESFDSFGKAYAFVETGEAADRLTFPASRQVIEGTPRKQAAYYKELLSFAQGRRAAFIITFIHRDYDALWDKIKATSPEVFMAWRDCGLLDESGAPRPAFDIWMQYLRMPLAAGR